MHSINLSDFTFELARLGVYNEVLQQRKETAKATEYSPTPVWNIPQVKLSHFFTLANVSLTHSDKAPPLQKMMRNSP